MNQIIDGSSEHVKLVLEQEYIDLMTQFGFGKNRKDLEVFFTNQRDQFFQTKNKRKWYNLVEIYKTEEDFLEKYLGDISKFFYKVYSENVHGNDAILEMGYKVKSFDDKDRYAIFFIEYNFSIIVSEIIAYASIQRKCQREINNLSNYWSRLIDKKNDNKVSGKVVSKGK